MKTRKLPSIVLSIIMIIAMSISAFAAAKTTNVKVTLCSSTKKYDMFGQWGMKVSRDSREASDNQKTKNCGSKTIKVNKKKYKFIVKDKITGGKIVETEYSKGNSNNPPYKLVTTKGSEEHEFCFTLPVIPGYRAPVKTESEGSRKGTSSIRSIKCSCPDSFAARKIDSEIKTIGKGKITSSISKNKKKIVFKYSIPQSTTSYHLAESALKTKGYKTGKEENKKTTCTRTITFTYKKK